MVAFYDANISRRCPSHGAVIGGSRAESNLIAIGGRFTACWTSQRHGRNPNKKTRLSFDGLAGGERAAWGRPDLILGTKKAALGAAWFGYGVEPQQWGKCYIFVTPLSTLFFSCSRNSRVTGSSDTRSSMSIRSYRSFV